MSRNIPLIWLCLGAFLPILAACQPGAPAAAPAEPMDPCEAALAPLADLSFSTELDPSGSVELEGGAYRAPAAPDSATEIVVELSEQAACGELNGIASATVVLVASAGGSGTFSSLHAVQPLDGNPAEVAHVLLGDRVKVERVWIEDDRILVEMITHAASDPLCCPTQAVTQSYALEGDQLRLVSTTSQNDP